MEFILVKVSDSGKRKRRERRPEITDIDTEKQGETKRTLQSQMFLEI